MLYNPHSQVSYEFVVSDEREEPALIEETIPQNSSSPPNILNLESKLTNADVPGVLYWMRQRVMRFLQPLYEFVGMVESGLGGKSGKYQYAFKSGVHSEKEIKTLNQLYSRHTHIPPYMIRDAILMYYISGDYADARENVMDVDEEDEGVDESEENYYRTLLDALGYPRFEDQSSTGAQLIGARGLNLEDNLIYYGPDENEVYTLWNAVLGDVTMGVLILATDEINTDCNKDFSLISLINSREVRGMFARFIYSKISTGRNNAQYGAGGGQGARYARYIVAPSYKQISAKSKFGVGMKLWFSKVYGVQVNDEGRTVKAQKIIQVIRQLVELPKERNTQQALQHQFDELQKLHDAALPRVELKHHRDTSARTGFTSRGSRRSGLGISF